jgi:hypothetical protein
VAEKPPTVRQKHNPLGDQRRRWPPRTGQSRSLDKAGRLLLGVAQLSRLEDVFAGEASLRGGGGRTSFSSGTRSVRVPLCPTSPRACAASYSSARRYFARAYPGRVHGRDRAVFCDIGALTGKGCQ